MRSEKQIEASRLNGAKSKGPITEKGKRHSRRNALKHGLLATSVVLDEEAHRAFDDIYQSTHAALEPSNAVEDRLTEMLAASFWKLSRAQSLAKIALDRSLATERPDLPAPERALAILASPSKAAVDYERLCALEAKAEGSIHRTLERLRSLRSSVTLRPDQLIRDESSSSPVCHWNVEQDVLSDADNDTAEGANDVKPLTQRVNLTEPTQ